MKFDFDVLYIFLFTIFYYLYLLDVGYYEETDTFVTCIDGCIYTVPQASKFMTLYQLDINPKTKVQRGILMTIDNTQFLNISDCRIAYEMEKYFKEKNPEFHIQRFPHFFLYDVEI